jgi:hypothetical protein
MKTLALTLSALLLCPPAMADVTVAYKFKSGGFRGMGASEGKGTRSVSGVKSREEGDSRLTGAILGKLSGSKETATVLRVDLDKVWLLDLKKKTYTEGPIKLPPPEKDDAKESGKKGKGKEEKPTHRIKSAKTEVKKGEESKTINGFKTAKWAATLTVVVEELETKKTSEFAMTTDIWATPWTKELRQAVDEEAKFAKAYLKKLGLEVNPADRDRYGLQGATMLLGSAGPEVEGALKKLVKELGSLDGYAVVTETTWRSPAPEQPKGKPAKEPEDDEEEGSALNDAAGAGSIGGAAAGFLGGMAKRAAKKKAKQKVKEHVEAAMGKPAFSVRHEVLSVDVSPVPSEKFELPAGFKKKD